MKAVALIRKGAFFEAVYMPNTNMREDLQTYESGTLISYFASNDPKKVYKRLIAYREVELLETAKYFDEYLEEVIKDGEGYNEVGYLLSIVDTQDGIIDTLIQKLGFEVNRYYYTLRKEGIYPSDDDFVTSEVALQCYDMFLAKRLYSDC